MAKSKNHTIHNQSCKWHKNDIKKPWSQRYKSLKGVDPKFLRNKDVEGLKKYKSTMQIAVSTLTEIIKACGKPKVVKPKMPKGPRHKLICLAFIIYHKLWKWI
ncbi:large ribosomal subunit protein eL29-like [Rattus norvegicus]|uniref:large ribosomal subunit protein eL29-like n=1 Tax=Rattus norvegicus TaxID=10116 RepID=UPI00001C7FC6|nr:60S ribosomal protein L29-like [Rattus norvegicus]